MANTSKPTVWHVFYDLLRHYEMRTMFGNPGSTEQPMLKNFPKDFQYVLGLQEASVVAMADGYSQATRKPVAVSLHTSAGTGNAMSSIATAFMNKTPLVLVAGQQTREMLIGDPLLGNRGPESMVQPFIKWAYQPVRAVDVPAALIRAVATAMLPPSGPVYLSIPLDDWDVEALPPPIPRAVSTRTSPDPAQLSAFAARIEKAKRMAIVFGAEVDKSLGWPAAISLAEQLNAPVFLSPLCDRASFPETHKLFKGPLPPARGPLSKKLEGHDLVLVVGAEVWRYYPYVEGPVLPSGTELLHITNDPHDAAAALVGECMLSDSKLALEALGQALKSSSPPKHDDGRHESIIKKALADSASNSKSQTSVMTAFDAFSTVAKCRPDNAILVNESPSNTADLLHAWPAMKPESYFIFASGALGWGLPASVGVALAQKHNGTKRPTVCAIGDGSLHYSVQALYTAAQQNVKLICLVPDNGQYAILKEFAVLEKTPNVPALDLPGLNAVKTADAYGVRAFRAENASELQKRFEQALKDDGPTLIEFPIDKELRPLVAQAAPSS